MRLFYILPLLLDAALLCKGIRYINQICYIFILSTSSKKRIKKWKCLNFQSKKNNTYTHFLGCDNYVHSRQARQQLVAVHATRPWSPSPEIKNMF